MSFHVGDRVILHGLSTNSMNGKKGTVLKFLEEEERWAVKVDGTDPAVLKTIKVANLKPQDTISIVVVPPNSPMRYEEIPATHFKAFHEAKRNFLESDSGEIHLHPFKIRGARGNNDLIVSCMYMDCNMFFGDNMELNRNMGECGWGYLREEIRGTVVLSFSYEERMSFEEENTYFVDAPDMATVKTLLREMTGMGCPGDPKVPQRLYVDRQLTVVDITDGLAMSSSNEM